MLKKNVCKLAALAITTLPTFAVADHASVILGAGIPSAISTESAFTLPEGRTSFNIRTEYISFDEFSDTKLMALRLADHDADLHSVGSLQSTSISLSHGVSDDFTIGIRVPFVNREDIREPNHHGDGIEKLGDIHGLGDTTIFGKYRFAEDLRTNRHASILFGIKAPTGDKHEKVIEDGERETVETEFQPGSGSWDTIFGLALTQVSGPIVYDLSAIFTNVGRGSQHTNEGDIFTYGAAASYRVGGVRPKVAGYSMESKPALDLIIELNGEWHDKENVHGSDDDNSGGNLVYLSPGVRFVSGSNVNFSLSVGLPIIENLNGDQVEPDYRVIGNLSAVF